MADPLSVIGFIIGIISLADVIVSKGTKLYTSVKDCPQEIRALVDETTTIYGLLAALQRRVATFQAVGNPSQPIPVLSRRLGNGPTSLLESCEQTLERVVKVITVSETKPNETLKNAAKRLQWKYRKEEVDELMGKLERYKSSFQVALSLDGMESLQQLLSGNAEIIQHILDSKDKIIQEIQVTRVGILSEIGQIENRQIQTEEDKRRDAQHREVLRWLSAIDYDAKHREVQRKRCENTGTWFVKSIEFTTWLESQAPFVLWCEGIPGAGKTFMTSKIVDDLKSRFPQPDVGIAYVYCDFKERASQTPEMILGIVLQQLLSHQRPSLQSRTIALYNNFMKQQKRPSVTELLSAIVSTSEEFTRIFLVFDALDECDEEMQRKDLLSCLEQLSQAPFKILVTSRPHPIDIRTSFKEAAKATIYANSNDIEAFVRRRIKEEKSRGITIKPDLENAIVDQILLKAKGMFLLASFQVEHILRHPTPKKKKAAATTLTSDLNATYETVMDVIRQRHESQQELAFKILTWIITATRPLHSSELQQAVAIEDDDTEIDEDAFPDVNTMVDLCGGLVAVERESGVVRLVHYTVQEYLLAHTTISAGAHSRIAKTCLTYLAFDIPNIRFCTSEEMVVSFFKHNLFLSYAAVNWSYHMKTSGEPEDLVQKAANILLSVPKCHLLAAFNVEPRNAAAKYYSIHDLASVNGSLRLTARLGLVRLTKALLDSGNIMADCRDGAQRTPLIYAAKNGHDSIVKLLVDRSDVDVNSRDKYGWTPLSWAALEGYDSVVKILVDLADVDANSRDGYGQTPLSHAALNGHSSVVKLLIDQKNVDADSRDDDDRTPLCHAALEGYDGVVKLLADRAAVNKNSRDRYGWTPLSWAALKGHNSVVKLLVDRADVDADSRGEGGRTPLSWAAQNGHGSIVNLLVGRTDVNTDSKDEDGRTPLSWAARKGQDSVVKLLIDRADVDPNPRDKYGQTPLSHAARGGYDNIVKLLADRNAAHAS